MRIRERVFVFCYTVIIMKMFFGILACAALLTVPMDAHAEDFYADAVVEAGSNLLSPENAVGQPDGAYADFRDADAAVTLDMGTEVMGDLSLTVYLLQSGAGYFVTFYNEAWETAAFNGAIIPIGTTTVTVTNVSGVAYRYVKIVATESEQWRLDAVMSAGAVIDDEEPVVEEELIDETPAASHTVGTLLKSDVSAAVYVLGSDGMRHAFPTEREFISWGFSFDDVVTITARALASYDLGRNVTVRPGTYLVKLQTNAKVFAVEPGGVLRWVSTANLASELYGTLWESWLIDVSDAFWGNYTLGEDIVTSVHPDGTVLQDSGEWYYVADGTKAVLSPDERGELRFRDLFAFQVTDDVLFGQYAKGVASLLTEGAQWPY